MLRKGKLGRKIWLRARQDPSTSGFAEASSDAQDDSLIQGGAVSLLAYIKRHPLWSIFVGALVLRLPLIDGSIDFFDSPQYLWRSAVPNLIDALSSGHAPYHPGYVLFTWLLHHLFGHGLDVNPTLIALVSVLASSASLVLIFLIAQCLFSVAHLDVHSRSVRSQVHSGSVALAWLTTSLVAISPYFWISSITILVDPVMIAFYLLSVWLYLEWLIRTGPPPSLRKSPSLRSEHFQSGPGGFPASYVLLLTSGLAFGYALFTHTQVAFWVLAFPALIILVKQPRQWLPTLGRSLPWIVGPLLFIAAYVGLLLYAGHNQTVSEALRYLIAGNAGDRSLFEIVSGARNLRLVGGSVLAVAAFIGSIRLLKVDIRKGLAMALWLYPGLIMSGLYVYSNLVGRASILALVPASLLAANLFLPPRSPRRWRGALGGVRSTIGIFILLGSTLAASLPLVLSYGHQPPMMEAINQVRKTLPRGGAPYQSSVQGGVYVSSNETKTLHDYPHFDVVFEQRQDEITKNIDAALSVGQPAYVGSDALTYPGYAVDGNHWRIFSLEGVNQARQHGSLAAYLFNRYEVDLVRQIGRYPLAVEQLQRPSQRPTVDRYRQSLGALAPGQTVVLGHVVDKLSAQPVSHLQVNAYGAPVLSQQRLDRFDWPTQLGTRLAIALGQRTRDPLFWSYTDASGTVAFPVPAGSTPTQFTFVTHTLATAATQAHPPLFVNPAVESINAGSETFIGSRQAVATQLAAQASLLASVTMNLDGTYTATLTPLAYTLQTSQSIKAAELSGQVSTIRPDGSRQAASGQKGNITFGPWKDLAPGRYSATWRLKRTSEGEDRVLRLDVGYNFGLGTIFEQAVGAGDLPLGQWRDITVGFTVTEEMKLLEFRTLALAGPGFIVDTITVKPR